MADFFKKMCEMTQKIILYKLRDWLDYSATGLVICHRNDKS